LYRILLLGDQRVIIDEHQVNYKRLCYREQLGQLLVQLGYSGGVVVVFDVICHSMNCSLASFYCLSHVSTVTVTRHIDIAILSIRPSRSDILWKRLNMLSVSSSHGSPIILVL